MTEELEMIIREISAGDQLIGSISQQIYNSYRNKDYFLSFLGLGVLVDQSIRHMLLATTGFSRWARSSAWIERVASDHQAVGSNPSGPVFNAMPAREPGRVCQLAFKSLAFNTPPP